MTTRKGIYKNIHWSFTQLKYTTIVENGQVYFGIFIHCNITKLLLEKTIAIGSTWMILIDMKDYDSVYLKLKNKEN